MRHDAAPGPAERDGPPGRDPNPRAVAGAAALLAAALGTFLWLAMLAGPWRLARGILDARRHLDKASTRLSAGATLAARHQTLAGLDAATRARSGLDAGGPLVDLARGMPVAGPLLAQAGHVVSAVEHSSAAAAGILSVAENGLEGPGAVIAKDPDDPRGGSLVRLDRLTEIAATVAQVRADVSAARGELEEIELQDLPRRARPVIREGIATATEADGRLADAESGFDILPALLGRDRPRRYLIAMQNPAEQRGTGGAILQFALLELDRGRATLLKGGGGGEGAKSVYEIDRERKTFDIPLPSDAWMNAGIEDAQRFGNANWSPHWPLSARLTIAYGRASARSNEDVYFPEPDGVIAVTPMVLEEVLPGVGPFNTDGLHVTANRVVHLLLYRTYAAFPRSSVRRAVLRHIVDGFFERVFQAGRPKAMVQGLGKALGQKDAQIWMKEPAEQAFIHRMRWSGAVDEAAGSDYLYVVEQNVGGNKFDYHTHHANRTEITLSGTGAHTTTEVTIANRLFLPQPRHTLGNSPRGLHRPMVNVYIPGNARLRDWAVRGTRLDTPAPATWPQGRPAVHDEAGKRVLTGTLEIPVGGEGSLRFDYDTPGVVRLIDGRSVYRLLVQHQPRVHPESATFEVTIPQGARDIRVAGWSERRGRVLEWTGELRKDMVLEVSWQS